MYLIDRLVGLEGLRSLHSSVQSLAEDVDGLGVLKARWSEDNQTAPMVTGLKQLGLLRTGPGTGTALLLLHGSPGLRATGHRVHIG